MRYPQTSGNRGAYRTTQCRGKVLWVTGEGTIYTLRPQVVQARQK